MTDSLGQVVLRREYAPYGELTYEVGSNSSLQPGFTDKHYDTETGLNSFLARYFIPGIGRWASADPKYLGVDPIIPSDVEARQVWSYARNRPTVLIDPQGRDTLYFGVNFGGFSQANGTNGKGTGAAVTLGFAIDTTSKSILAFGSSAWSNFDTGKVIGTSVGAAVVAGYVKGPTDENFLGLGTQKSISASIASESQLYSPDGQRVGTEYGRGFKGLPGSMSYNEAESSAKGVRIFSGKALEGLSDMAQSVINSLERSQNSIENIGSRSGHDRSPEKATRDFSPLPSLPNK